MTTQKSTEVGEHTTTTIQTSRESELQGRAQPMTLTPATDIHETAEGASIIIDLPGVSKDSLEINVDHDVLTIKGGIDLNTPEDLNPTYMDVHAGAFSRKFTLSAELDSARVDASLKDGVLNLKIPRSEKHRPRKIEVKSA